MPDRTASWSGTFKRGSESQPVSCGFAIVTYFLSHLYSSISPGLGYKLDARFNTLRDYGYYTTFTNIEVAYYSTEISAESCNDVKQVGGMMGGGLSHQGSDLGPSNSHVLCHRPMDRAGSAAGKAAGQCQC